MLSYIKGILTEVNSDGIVVENNDMGYDIKVPLSVVSKLPLVGKDIKIYTYLYVREDIISLYGFLSKDDLWVFKLLIGVNGIGPKVALGILSSITPDDLRFAVLSDDVKTITKAPGIGNKTAQRLIIELKDKLKLENIIDNINDTSKHSTTGFINDAVSEAIQALTALGYSNSEAVKVVRQIENSDNMNVEEILKQSLKKISSI